MNSKFRNLSRKARERIRRGLIRSWQPGGTHRELQRARGLRSSAETARRRAAWDAKGQVEFTAVFPDGTQLLVRRALRGRSDQLDVVLETETQHVTTASAPKTMSFLLRFSALRRDEEIEG